MRQLITSLVISMGIVGAFLLNPTMAIAQFDPVAPACSGPAAQSAACDATNTTSNPIVGPTGILTRVIQLVVIFTAVVAVIVIMIGGLKYITSMGDPNSVNSAKNTILYAVIGLVVAMAGQIIVSFVLGRV